MSACRRRSRRSWRSRPSNIARRAGRRGSSKSSAIKRGRVGRERGALPLATEITRGGQGRTPREGLQSALCDDLVAEFRVGDAGVVRGAVLCPRRDGEPHQGTTDAVLRPHQYGRSAQQSNSLVLFFRGLRADAGVAATGITGNRMGPGTVHDGAAEAAENRGADSHHRVQSMGVNGHRLPVRGTVSADLCSASGSALAGVKQGMHGGFVAKDIDRGTCTDFGPQVPANQSARAPFSATWYQHNLGTPKISSPPPNYAPKSSRE
jgi:hypothetical protein